jgi:hypothetical protein
MIVVVVSSMTTTLVGCKGGSSENAATDSTATADTATSVTPTGIPTMAELKAKLDNWTIPAYDFNSISNSEGNIANLNGRLYERRDAKAGYIDYGITDYQSVSMCSMASKYENVDSAKALILKGNNNRVVVARTITVADKSAIVLHVDRGPVTSMGGGKRVYVQRAVREGDRFVTLQVDVVVKEDDFASAEGYAIQVMEHLTATIGQ